MLLKRLFGRRAEPKDPDAQQAQVASALESTEVNVRRDACRQLTDLRRLRTLADADSDAGVRELAEARYRRLLCGLDAAAPSLATRLAELARIDIPEVLAQVAIQAKDAELRLAAISQLENDEVLASCASNDLVAANRLAAAERVQTKEALERLAKAIGKRDKRIFRLARERLKQLIEEEERPLRARELGAAICERMERLGRFDNWLQDHAVLGHLEQQWQAIGADADDTLQARFQRLRRDFLDRYEAYQRAPAAQAPEPVSDAVARPDQDVSIEQLHALTQSAAELDLSALEQAQQQLQDLWRNAGQPEAARSSALEQAYREAEQALKAQQRRLRQRTQTRQTAEQLLTDLRRHSERSAGPDRRALESLRKRRRSLPSTPALTNRDAITASTAEEPSTDNDAEAIASSASERSMDATQVQPSPPLAALEEIDELLERLERRLERHQKQLLRKLESLPERLSELEAHLQDGELKKADPLYQSISATLEHGRSAGVGREILAAADERLKQVAPQLRELRHWRRWSTDEHRAQICAQIEALATDTQHADEPSINRLEQLKGQWQMLDRQGAPADDALWARFRQAAEQIRERCRPYLEAQAALRSENRKQREALAKRLEDFLAKVDWERVDWKKLHRAEREMRLAWNRLIEAPGGDNHGTRDRAIEGRFRRALRRLDQSLAEERERNQAEKLQLLEQMQALAQEPDLRKAIDAAKQLQGQWHTTVPARHRDENALWQQFRAASDAIFARRAAESEARGASLRENQATRESICQDLLALANAEQIRAPDRFAQQIGELKTRWSDTEALPVPRQVQSALNRQWREALAAARARLASLHEAERWAGLERLAQRATYCDQAGRELAAAGAESTVSDSRDRTDDAIPSRPGHSGSAAVDCERLQQGWDGLPKVEDATLAKAIDQAFDQVLGYCRNPSQRRALNALLAENLAQRESLCLSLEIISQVESPQPLQAERMQRQVERLRDRMAEGESDGSEDISALLRSWYLSCPAQASASLDARFDRIKKALFESASQAEPDPGALST